LPYRCGAVCASAENVLYDPGVESEGSSFEVSAQRGGLEVLEGLADEWRALAAQSPDDEPFYRPEWITAIIRAFFPDSKVLVISARANGSLKFVLPFLQERALFYGVPVLRLRSPVSVHSCRFDAVRCTSSKGEQAVRAAWRYLKEEQAWDLLELSDIPEESAVGALVCAAEADGFRSARIPMRPNPIVDIKELEKLPRNARLRGKLRQVRRELATKGSLQLCRGETANREMLERFYALEAGGWKGGEGSAIRNDVRTTQFYNEIAEVAARHGYLSLYMLEFDGQLVAGHFGLCLQGRYYSPKLSYEERQKDLAAGHLIISEILRDCAARGVHTYDITGPDDEWKMKWTDQVRRRSMYFVFRDSAVGSLAYTLRFRLRPAIKRLSRLGSGASGPTELSHDE
jgi:CelD/BcsL family acetyltransferase involved in cellulose biosynthesis